MVKRILALSLLMVLSSCATGADDTVDALVTGRMCCGGNNGWADPFLWVTKIPHTIVVCQNVEAGPSAQCNEKTAYYGS